MLKWKWRMPKREELLNNRLLRPFAHRLANPSIWRFNRRSVTRGVAVGLFFGILFPVAHTGFAVLAAIPTRSNAIIAACSTWLINPLTIPPVLMGAHWIGARMVHVPVPTASGWLHRSLAWLAQTASGLLPMALLVAVLGYGLMQFVWRLRVRRRWAARPGRRSPKPLARVAGQIRA